MNPNNSNLNENLLSTSRASQGGLGKPSQSWPQIEESTLNWCSFQKPKGEDIKSQPIMLGLHNRPSLLNKLLFLSPHRV